LVLLIRLYQRFISPALPPSCRYWPSCSSYAVEAVQKHGALRGSWLALRRLGRCHPWHAGGYDPVPPVGERAAASKSSSHVNHAEPSSTDPHTAAQPAAEIPDARPANAEAPTPRSNAA